MRRLPTPSKAGPAASAWLVRCSASKHTHEPNHTECEAHTPSRISKEPVTGANQRGHAEWRGESAPDALSSQLSDRMGRLKCLNAAHHLEPCTTLHTPSHHASINQWRHRCPTPEWKKMPPPLRGTASRKSCKLDSRHAPFANTWHSRRNEFQCVPDRNARPPPAGVSPAPPTLSVTHNRVVDAWAMMLPPIGFLLSPNIDAPPSTCATTWLVITHATPKVAAIFESALKNLARCICTRQGEGALRWHTS